MLIQVNIKYYDYHKGCNEQTFSTNYYYKDFDSINSFEEVKEAYINTLDLVNSISNFNKSKLYFFVDNTVIKPDKKISDVISGIITVIYITALYDFDDNFTLYNTYIWLSSIEFGDYYIFCPRDLTINYIVHKYEKYLESKDFVKPDKIKLIFCGTLVNNEDPIEKYLISSYYTVFRVQL